MNDVHPRGRPGSKSNVHSGNDSHHDTAVLPALGLPLVERNFVILSPIGLADLSKRSQDVVPASISILDYAAVVISP